jgi:hypothetical protein
MAWNTVYRAPLLAALVLAATTGQASAEPKEHRHRQQVLATGAEDAPAAARRSVADEAAQADLERMTSRSTEGLTPVLHADGTVSVDLEGRFMSVLVADDAGQVSCRTHAGDAASATGAPARSRPSEPLPGRADRRGAPGAVQLPAAPVTSSPALEER